MANLNEQEKQKLIDVALGLRNNGRTNTEISKILDVPRSTLFGWIGGSTKKFLTEETITSDENDFFDVNTFNKIYNANAGKDDVLKFLEELAPIQYPAPVRSGVKKEATKMAAVIGDTHFGLEDWNTLNIFLETVSLLRPAKVILNGDTMDMFAVSKYAKDARHEQSLHTEREAYHKFLKMLHDVVVDWDCEIFETNANHSGNGQEGRWWRYLSDNLGPAASLPEVIEAMSYENIFFPQKDWCKIKLVDEVVLPTNFIVHHGTVVRKHGGMSARGEYEKKNTSTLTNHTHRIGFTAQRSPAAGDRPEQIFTNYENACACKLNPDYVTDANWQNGFALVNYSDNVIGVEQVVVHGNVANISALGKTVTAI
jgi:hypothetical protein